MVFLQQQPDTSSPQQSNAVTVPRGVAWLQEQQVTDRQLVAACVPSGCGGMLTNVNWPVHM